MNISLILKKVKGNHALMMTLLCIIPLAGFFIIIYVFNIGVNFLLFLGIFLCVIMHVFMMKDMHKHHEGEAATMNQKDKKKGKCC